MISERDSASSGLKEGKKISRSTSNVLDRSSTTFLWSVPRSLSTAFTKCVSFVDDVEIWFEPYVCAYGNAYFRDPKYYQDNPHMNNARRRYYGSRAAKDVLPDGKDENNWTDEKEMTYSWVQSQLEKKKADRRRTFVKDMIFAINGDLGCEFLPRVKCKHTFLIRNPVAVFLSFKRAITFDPEFNEVPFSTDFGIREANLIKDYGFFPLKNCYQQLLRMWKDVGKIEGTNPIVIDADELARAPDILLRKYFEAVGFPWKKEYLTWDAGYSITKTWKTSRQRMDSTQATWRIWYQRSIGSSKFIPTTKSLPCVGDWTRDLQELVQEAMPYYEEMYKCRIRACS